MLRSFIERMFRSTMRPSNPAAQVVITEDYNEAAQSDKASTSDAVDNSQHVLLKIATLYAEKLMNDICLVVGGVEYPAHRLILCASSEVFQVMLMNPQWSESHESRVILQETPACAQIFGQFIRYFYTGQITFSLSTIIPLLALADKYNVKDLTDLCLNYMCNHVATAASNSQLVTWYQYTLSLGHNTVALECQNFLKWNFEQVANTKDFGNCSHEILSKLLQLNDLVVSNEITLFNYIANWVEFQKQSLVEDGVSGDTLEAYLESLVYEVMSHIRFPMMTPRQLADLLLNPLTCKYKDFFVEKMAIGMAFHSGHSTVLRELTREDTGKLQFTPRLYTAETFSSTLIIEQFNTFPFYQTRTLFFSSHASIAEHLGDKLCDWVIDFSPKGVWFPKSLLIVWQGTVEVPESLLCTVRLSITCRDVTDDNFKVKIGVLVVGLQDNIEHIVNVVEKNFYFSKEDPVLNINDVIPYPELNPIRPIGSPNDVKKPSPKYLLGPKYDILKIHVVIAPLSDESSIVHQPTTLISAR